MTMLFGAKCLLVTPGRERDSKLSSLFRQGMYVS
jgi:hypothetical protein